MKLLKTFGILLIVVAIFGGAMFGLNFVTGDRIAANKAAAESGPLAEVMPEGKSFEELDITALELPASITKVYKETEGKGFVFEVTAEGYKPGLVILCGINAEGKITGSVCIETNDTFKKEPEIDNKYNGQSMDDFKPVMIGGATMTSNGYAAAIEAALQANVIVGGGELGPEVALKNMIPTLYPDYKDLKDVAITSEIAIKAYAPASGIGMAYVMVENDIYYLVVSSMTGACKVYNDAGTDVTADHAAVVAEALRLNAAKLAEYTAALEAKAKALISADATDFENLDYPAFSSIVSAISFKDGGAVYYGFYSRVIGYNNTAMEIFVILDEDGAIAKVDATEMIILEEHFHGFGGVPGGYKPGFVGVTEGTWNDDIAAISGATISSNAMKEAVQNAFAAFNSINEGGNQ